MVATVETKPKAQEVRFDEMVIIGDLELEKLNDEELFAAGTSFYAAEDYTQAARYFGRICDFHPESQAPPRGAVQRGARRSRS